MPRYALQPNSLYGLHEVPMTDVLAYQRHEIDDPFIIMLKVPSYDERFLDDHKHFTKSNINVCYAAPRSAKKPRSWYESQLNVSNSVRNKPGYPMKGIPFYVVTDDGYGFLAHTTSQNNKQFSAIGDELILGKWLKNRLIAEGLVKPVDNTAQDVTRSGMITKEMLDKYGCNAIAFQKTSDSIADPSNSKNRYSVWTLKMVMVSTDNG